MEPHRNHAGWVVHGTTPGGQVWLPGWQHGSSIVSQLLSQTVCASPVPYGTTWYQMVPYGTIWYHVVPLVLEMHNALAECPNRFKTITYQNKSYITRFSFDPVF